MKTLTGSKKQTTIALLANNEISIQVYRGYAGSQRFIVGGRIVTGGGARLADNQSQVRTLIENFRRFETDELRNWPLTVQVFGETYETITDSEGYFWLDEALPMAAHTILSLWVVVAVQTEYKGAAYEATGELFIPSPGAKLGIISDVDDTVLQTYASSVFRLKMLQATFLLDPFERAPMEGIPQLFGDLEKGRSGQEQNPVFYVSNSPWNIYDNIVAFLDAQALPKGPVLLRDAGLHLLQSKPDEEIHKIRTIRHILATYPELPFILFGDTASHDADYYLKLAADHPEQIKAIYIRQTRLTPNARRVAQVLQTQHHIPAILVKNSREMREHLQSIGLLEG